MSKDGWFIKDNKVYFRSLQNQSPRTKIVKNDDGSTSTITFNPSPTPQDTPIELTGWKKIVSFEDIILIRVPNPNNYYKLENSLFHRIYEIDVQRYSEANPCRICGDKGTGSKWHFLRDMNAGVYYFCVLFGLRGITASGPILTATDREGNMPEWCKLVSEKKVSKGEAKMILSRLERIPSLQVSAYLSGLEVV